MQYALVFLAAAGLAAAAPADPHARVNEKITVSGLTVHRSSVGEDLRFDADFKFSTQFGDVSCKADGDWPIEKLGPNGYFDGECRPQGLPQSSTAGYWVTINFFGSDPKEYQVDVSRQPDGTSLLRGQTNITTACGADGNTCKQVAGKETVELVLVADD